MKAPPSRLFLEWGYAAEFFSAGSPSPHGVFTDLSFALSDNWSLYAGARLMESAGASKGAARVSVGRYPFEAGVRRRLHLDPWHVGFSLAGVAEVLSRDASADLGHPAVEPADDQVLGAVYAGVSAGRALGNTSEMFIELGASIYINNADYSSGAETLLSTWTVRPAARVGLNLGIF